eukprot:235145-Prymnesium_polylepis.2
MCIRDRGGGGNAAAWEAAIGSLASTLASMGAGEWDAAAAALEKLADAPMSPRMRRALKWLTLLQQSSAAGADLSRIGALLSALLSQRRIQQQLLDVSLQIAERGVQRGIQTLYGLEPQPQPTDHERG